MAELTPEQVRRMAAAIGIPIADADLPEVTLRLNATLEELKALDQPESPGQEPWAAWWAPEG